MGVDVDIKPGDRPVVGQPVRRDTDLAQLRGLEPSDVPYLAPAISSLVAELGSTPLIGFAGRPVHAGVATWSKAGPSKNQERTKALMYGNPRAVACPARPAHRHHHLVPADPGPARCLRGPAVDSWVGTLSPEDYRAAVLPHSKRVFEALAGTGVAAAPLRRRHRGTARPDERSRARTWSVWTGGSAWTRRSAGWTSAPRCRATSTRRSCWHPGTVVERRARDVLARGRTAEGHIFNLGHGVLPETEPDVLARLTDYVHEQTVQEDATGTR